MKKYLITLALVSVALPLCAQNYIPMDFTISATVTSQNANVKQVGVDVTISAPVKQSITTASLLKTMAYDEYLAGNYAQTTFPAGVKIVYMQNSDNNLADNYFIVTDSKGDLLVSVANLLTFSQVINTEVGQGGYNATTGLASSTGFTQTDVKVSI